MALPLVSEGEVRMNRRRLIGLAFAFILSTAGLGVIGRSALWRGTLLVIDPDFKIHAIYPGSDAAKAVEPGPAAG